MHPSRGAFQASTNSIMRCRMSSSSRPSSQKKYRRRKNFESHSLISNKSYRKTYYCTGLNLSFSFLINFFFDSSILLILFIHYCLRRRCSDVQAIMQQFLKKTRIACSCKCFFPPYYSARTNQFISICVYKA